MHYYNEIDRSAAEWIRRLISRGLLPAGKVDERDIREVKPEDLGGFAQCHFFAGIGGWALALRLAGWDDHRPAWTGSCPCQPFSVCGKKRGVADERHLWPEFRRLIDGCRPSVVFGEQVASNDGLEWLSGVRADLEASHYEVGAADLPAAGVKAPHIRQRIWWVADTSKPLVRQESPTRNERGYGEDHFAAGRLSNAEDTHWWCGKCYKEKGAGSTEVGRRGSCQCSSPDPWSDYTIVECGDGKARRLESGLVPLAHGVPDRMVKLRGYGNAIVPPLAAKFIVAYREAREGVRA